MDDKSNRTRFHLTKIHSKLAWSQSLKKSQEELVLLDECRWVKKHSLEMIVMGGFVEPFTNFLWNTPLKTKRLIAYEMEGGVG